MQRKSIKFILVLTLAVGLCLLPTTAQAGGHHRSSCSRSHLSAYRSCCQLSARTLCSQPQRYFYIPAPGCPTAASADKNCSGPSAACPQSAINQPADSKLPAEPSSAPQTPSAAPTEIPPSANAAVPENSMPNAAEAQQPDPAAAEVIELVNQERLNAGLEPLQENSLLAQAAAVRAEEILISFSHTRPNGSSCFSALQEAGCRYQKAGENLALGQQTAVKAVSDWMNSPGHRANILDPRFRQIGVAVRPAPGGGYAWTQFFSD